MAAQGVVRRSPRPLKSTSVSTPPTGEQYEIGSGDARAVVTEVGATLRSYAVEGRDVVRGFAERRGDHGRPRPEPAALAEPDPGRPLHLRRADPATGADRAGPAQRHPRAGPLRALGSWSTGHRSRSTNRVRIYPQSGWPGSAGGHDHPPRRRRRADGDGRGDEHRPGRLPFGYAAHPYFTVGEAAVDEVEVTIPAASYLEVDDRLLPLRISPVDRHRARISGRHARWARPIWTPR